MHESDLTIPSRPKPAGTYVKGLLPFIWKLRDYGFTPTVQEIEQALSAVRNITDVEDVLYTAQSALCHNKEQADVFQSLFCREFLGYKLDSPTEEAPQRPIMDDEALEQLKARAETVREKISDITGVQSRVFTLRIEWEEAEKKAVQAQETVIQAKLARQAAISAAIRSGDRKFLEVLQKGLSALSDEKERTRIRGAVETALAQADAPVLDALKQEMLNKALIMRGEKKDSEYRAYAVLAAEIQKIASLIRKLRLALGKKKEFERLDDAIRHAKNNAKALRSAAGHAEEMYKLEMQRDRSLHTAEHELRTIEARIRDAIRDRERYEQHQSRLIQGGPSVNHRDMFIGGHNAVQKADAVGALLNSEINRLSNDEIQKISLYIRSNARKFQQTLRKNMAAHQRKRLDIKKTVEKSMRTDGDIARLYYKKPRPSKARVVLLADISGSCRASASLALNFLGLMGEVFPGGCHPFVFVNHLIPVGQYFQDDNVETAVQAINTSIPTRGIYSDYGMPLRQLVLEHRGLISSDTTVILLGDCRNNRNYPAEDKMRWLCEHAHRVSVLVPEERAKWGTGDSIVPLYQAAGAETMCVQTAQQLIEFLLTE